MTPETHSRQAASKLDVKCDKVKTPMSALNSRKSWIWSLDQVPQSWTSVDALGTETRVLTGTSRWRRGRIRLQS